MTRIDVHHCPVAQPRHRSGRFGHYIPADHAVHTYKQMIVAAWKSVRPRPKALTCPVKLLVIAYMPYSAGHRKWTSPSETWFTPKPDWDNLGKSVSDALKGLAWLDDAQVCDARVIKAMCQRGVSPKVVIVVDELKELTTDAGIY